MTKANIMLVEDEALVALEIKRGLEDLGYHVTSIASSGEEALQKITEETPDLVLMDIRLDGAIDGIETAKRIKEDLSIPVIYLTAYSDEKTINRAKQTESFAYILKPFEEKALNAAIEIALYKAQQERKIKEDSEWLSIIIRSINEGVIVSDIKGAIKFINNYGEGLIKWKQEHIINKMLQNVFKIIDKKNGAPVKLPISPPIIEDRIIHKTNCILINKEKKEISIDYSIAPLKNVNRNTVGMVLLFKESHKDYREAKILKKDLETPLEIQKKLLPQNGEIIYGIKANWMFYPSKYGSGDIFNFFSLDKYNLGFFMLDVMGHGFSAALFSIILNRFLSPASIRGGILRRKKEITKSKVRRRRSDFLSDILSPKEVVIELNKRFSLVKNGHPFFTVVYGIIEKETGLVRMVRAGHPYPIFQNVEGDTHYIKSGGCALGIKSDVTIEEYSFILNKGDRIYIYSDGLIELEKREKNQSGQDYLMDFIKKSINIPMPDVLLNIENETKKIIEDIEYHDDIALLALEKVS